MHALALDRKKLISLAGLSIILFAVILCIWPGMHAPLFTDDIHQIEMSKQYAKWTDIFKTDVFGFYRPVKNAIFLLGVPLEKNLVAWHWLGLAAYLAAAVGIHRIVGICLQSRRAAWLATFLWALSPACVSTVLWVSCANISIGIMFAACVFHFHEQWATRSSFKALAACAFFYGCALLCYESMIAIPGLLFIRDFQQRRLAFDRRTVTRYAIYTLVALAFLVVRHQFSAKSIGDHNFHPGFAPDTKPIELTLSAPWFLWRHFLMWIFPFGKLELLGSYAWLRSASVASLVFGWVFLAALLTTAAITWKRLPAVSYGLLFFVVASLPAGNFIPNFNGPINDAYVTIPSIGLALAFAAACEHLYALYLARRRAAESGCLAVMAVLAVFLLYRGPICGAYFAYWAKVWENPVELMLLSSESRPYQFQPKAYVSVLLYDRGYVEQAEIMAREVIAEAPWNATARLTLAKTAIFRKDDVAAEGYYRYILDSPNLEIFLKEPALIGLAGLLANKPDRHEEAAQLFRQFLKSARTGKHPDAIAMLARIYQDEGKADKARSTLVRGLSLHPKDEQLKKMLASMDQAAPAGAAMSN